MPVLKTYLLFIRAGFKSESQYLMAVVAGIAANSTFGVIKASVMLYLAKTNGTVAGYQQKELLNYVWVAQAILGLVTLHAVMLPICDRIKNGDIAIDFIRPIRIFGANLSQDFGRSLFNIIPRTLPTFMVGAIFFGTTIALSPTAITQGVLALIFAVCNSFAAYYLISLIGFWVTETKGIGRVNMICATFLSGLFVPIAFFPSWLQTVAYLTPFPTVIQVPTDIISGYSDQATSWQLLGLSAGWFALLTCAISITTHLGRKSLEVQGG